LNTPHVSVIIPVYNAVPYIHECMESVLSQTLRDIEIICIDDGSTDGSLDILKKYEVVDNRVRILCQKNSGAGSARNLGINNATGDFIAFIDADDLYPEADIIEELYSKAVQKNVNICGGSLSDLRNGEIKTLFNGTLAKQTFQEEGFVSFKEYQFDYGYFRFIYKRIFLLKNNLVFPDYRRFQDPPFFVKAMLCSEMFYAIPKITYCYRYDHKEINWDYRNVNDCLNGMIDILKLSIEHQLPFLHKIVVDQLNKYSGTYFKYIFLENLELLTLLLEANKLIDIEMLKEAKHPLNLFNGHFVLDILQDIRFKKRCVPATISKGFSFLRQNGLSFTIKRLIYKLEWR